VEVFSTFSFVKFLGGMLQPDDVADVHVEIDDSGMTTGGAIDPTASTFVLAGQS